MQRPASVLIVLGTHNGSQYLAEFLQSVRSQSDAGWKMLVRDDASTDGTAAILREMAAADRRIEVLTNDSPRGGAAENFAKLLMRAAESNAQYVFLADQDDVWLPNKIRGQLDVMRRMESRVEGRRLLTLDTRPWTPLLVYSDLTVVDAGLRTIHGSFFRQARFGHDANCPSGRRPLQTLLAHNFVPGCSMLLNRPLLDLVVPVPASAPVHDWWIALCAAAAGRLVFLDEPTLLYRQHPGNLIGARSRFSVLNPLRASWKKRWQQGKANFARHVQQTEALRQRLQQRAVPCPTQTHDLLQEYCRLLEPPTGVFRRIDGMHRLGVPKATLLRRLTFYARMLTVNRR